MFGVIVVKSPDFSIAFSPCLSNKIHLNLQNSNSVVFGKIERKKKSWDAK